MSSESRKGMVRILSNYVRLLITLALGMLVVPMTIRWLGDDAFGIISLLGANIGLAAVFRQIIQQSLIRELGSAYHADDATFRKIYASICQIAIGCTLLTLISFAVVFILVPVFQIPREFVGPARWFVVGQGLSTAALIILAPILNMYLVKEQFVGYNIWYIAVRSTNIIAVGIFGYVYVIDDPALGFKLLGITWGVMASIAVLIAAIVMVSKDYRLMFRIRGSDKEARKQVLSTFSWNTGVQVAMNLHEQIPPLLLNLFFGPLANASWGIGFRFVAYIRMCTTGVQFGSDAVSARLAANADTDDARKKLQRLISIQTKLTSMIALPAGALVLVYGWPIFHAWVGHSIREYSVVMPVAVYVSRILAIALIARAISETWMIILYGSGHIRAYAPWIFGGGIFAPVASIILMLVLPKSLVVYAPPTMFALVFVVVHLFGLPIIAGKCLHIQASSLLLSLVRPFVTTLISLGLAMLVLVLGGRLGDLGIAGELTSVRGDEIQWKWILGSLLIFGATYSLGAYLFVMDQSERNRIKGILSRFKRISP